MQQEIEAIIRTAREGISQWPIPSLAVYNVGARSIPPLTRNHRSPVRIRPQAPKNSTRQGAVFLLSLPGFEVYPPCGENRPQAPKNSTRQGAVFLLSLPGFEVYPPCGEIRPQAPKNSTRQGAVFGLPESLSLRASPRREASALGVQTGAAIRPTCGQAAIPVCRLIRLFAGTARCRSPAPSSPPWWPRSG